MHTGPAPDASSNDSGAGPQILSWPVTASQGPTERARAGENFAPGPTVTNQFRIVPAPA